MRNVRSLIIFRTTYGVDVLVQEAVDTLLVVGNEKLVALGLEPGAETELQRDGCVSGATDAEGE